MGALSEAIKDPAKRRAIIDDGVRVVEQEVSNKRGMSGLAVKAGFKVVKGVKPGIIGEALNMFLEDFSAKVDPYYDRCQQSGGNLRAYFVANSEVIADDLLSIVDSRAERAKHRTLKKAYFRLRPQGKKHTIEAMPAVAGLVERHVK
jgi:hypothetical protein